MSIINQGFIFGLVALAVHLTSRIIKKDDLTVEGSFGLGGAITAVLLINNVSGVLILPMAIIFGVFCGVCTGILHTRLKMNHLMAGLVVTTGCFSLSLYLAGANAVINDSLTIFAAIPWIDISLAKNIWLLVIAMIAFFLVFILLRSELGLLLKTAGENPNLILRLAKSPNFFIVLGFAVANGLVALAGSLFVQWSGFFSITGNIGTLITGLAGLMIAEVIFVRLSPLIFLAAMIYQSVFAATILVGLNPIWNNAIKAMLIILLVLISKSMNRKDQIGNNHA
jgi:putative ABC transport system permease protein